MKHGDDFVMAGDNEFLDNIEEKLRKSRKRQVLVQWYRHRED